jgi:hypothetical protein
MPSLSLSASKQATALARADPAEFVFVFSFFVGINDLSLTCKTKDNYGGLPLGCGARVDTWNRWI